jgi:hypothetical protein
VELLLIPFLLISGTTLIYLGVHGVPAAPWLQSVTAASSRRDSATVQSRQPDAPAKAQAIEVEAVEPAARAPESGEVANIRQARRHFGETLADGHVTDALGGETEGEKVVDITSPDGQFEPAPQVQLGLRGTDEPTPKARERASTDVEKEGAVDGADRIGPAPTFNEADALFGEVLMEMSLVRNELQHLHKRVETLSSKQPARTRAPGGPRRRRLRRVGGF